MDEPSNTPVSLSREVVIEMYNRLLKETRSRIPFEYRYLGMQYYYDRINELLIEGFASGTIIGTQRAKHPYPSEVVRKIINESLRKSVRPKYYLNGRCR